MLHLSLCEAHSPASFDAVEEQSVTMLLFINFIDKCIKSIFPGKWKAVLTNSSAVPMVMVYENGIDNGSSSTEESALLILQAVPEARVFDIKIDREFCLKSH